jgi:hypothetical protein
MESHRQNPTREQYPLEKTDGDPEERVSILRKHYKSPHDKITKK